MMRPGDLLGMLEIAGNNTQTANGETEIDLRGTQQGVAYSLFKIDSLTTLGSENMVASSVPEASTLLSGGIVLVTSSLLLRR